MSDHALAPDAPDAPGAAVKSPEKPQFQISASRGFASWLRQHRCSLMFSTYQVGKVFALGTNPDGRLSIVERTFPRCLGLSVANNGQTVWLSSLYQIWRLDNFLSGKETYQDYDSLYVPQFSSVTGDLDVHDLAQRADGTVTFVNTRFSCLAGLSRDHSFSALWKPPFISKIAAEDRCHLNGLAMEEGEPRYVTAVSRSDMADGWRDRRNDGGVVIDVKTNEIVCQGLSMPHSPRLHGGSLYLHNSGRGEFGRVDVATGTFHPIAFCPGYLRGLDFVGDFAIVGLSRPRHDGRFSGLALDDLLKERDSEPRCGLMVIDLKSGDAVEWLTLEGDLVSELYDVAHLPGTLRPMIIGTKGEEIRRMVRFDNKMA